MTAEPIPRPTAAATSADVRPAGELVDRGRTGVPPLLGVIWTLLIVNTLGPGGSKALIPVSGAVAQLITTAALGLAFVLTLVLNPRMRVRPNAFLFLLTLLVLTSVVSSTIVTFGLGGFARCARLTLFVATLWLLTPFWNDGMAFVRFHVRALLAVLATVVVGLAVAPGLAIPEDGRLAGVLWYLPATDVAQYAVIVMGLTLVLWISQPREVWSSVAVAGGALVLLLLAHTRTATAAMVVALAVAGLSLTVASARARRIAIGGAVVVALAAPVFGPAVEVWFRRGQSADELRGLTGRQAFWDNLLADPRSPLEKLFGLGLNNKSFDGLPIDNSWLTVYNEQGMVGVAIIAALCLALVAAAVTRRPSPGRACAVFLVVYCLMASYTEVGLGDASPYLLHLFVAAALLAPCAGNRSHAG